MSEVAASKERVNMLHLFSGCWLSQTTDECENNRCSYDTTQSLVTLNQKVNFCCCHGSMCNKLEKGSMDGGRKKDKEKPETALQTISTAGDVEEGWYRPQCNSLT